MEAPHPLPGHGSSPPHLSRPRLRGVPCAKTWSHPPHRPWRLPKPPSAPALGSAQSSVGHRPLPISATSLAPAAPTWRFVGLAHGNYALFETAAGLVLLDRPAAHERIWFERLREQFRSGAVPSQRLLLPVPIELDAISAALLLDRLKFLHAHGFEMVELRR